MHAQPSSLSPTARNLGCAILAVTALVGTWGHNVAYLSHGFLGANVRFWQDTLANPAARSITFDLFALVLPVMCWMFSEARRLSLSGIWLYVLGSILVAISVALPVFLIHRTRVQVRRGELNDLSLRTPDFIGLGLLAALSLLYLLWSFGWLG